MRSQKLDTQSSRKAMQNTKLFIQAGPFDAGERTVVTILHVGRSFALPFLPGGWAKPRDERSPTGRSQSKA